MSTLTERKTQSTKRKFDDVILQKSENFMDEMLFHSTNLFWLKYQSGLQYHTVVGSKDSWKIEIPFVTGQNFITLGAKRSALIKSITDNCPFDLGGWKIEFETRVPSVVILTPTNKQEYPLESDRKLSNFSTVMTANKRAYLFKQNSSKDFVENEKIE
jgi:hypothetical protein